MVKCGSKPHMTFYSIIWLQRLEPPSSSIAFILVESEGESQLFFTRKKRFYRTQKVSFWGFSNYISPKSEEVQSTKTSSFPLLSAAMCISETANRQEFESHFLSSIIRHSALKISNSLFPSNRPNGILSLLYVPFLSLSLFAISKKYFFEAGSTLSDLLIKSSWVVVEIKCVRNSKKLLSSSTKPHIYVETKKGYKNSPSSSEKTLNQRHVDFFYVHLKNTHNKQRAKGRGNV